MVLSTRWPLPWISPARFFFPPKVPLSVTVNVLGRKNYALCPFFSLSFLHQILVEFAQSARSCWRAIRLSSINRIVVLIFWGEVSFVRFRRLPSSSRKNRHESRFFDHLFPFPATNLRQSGQKSLFFFALKVSAANKPPFAIPDDVMEELEFRASPDKVMSAVFFCFPYCVCGVKGLGSSLVFG